MRKKIEDYLNLYLGCDVQLPSGKMIRKLVAVNIEFETALVGDIVYDSIAIKPILRPLSSIETNEFHEICDICEWNKEEYDKDWFWSEWEDNRLALYPLQCVALTKYLLSKSFDLFGLIEAGLAIDTTTIK